MEYQVLVQRSAAMHLSLIARSTWGLGVISAPPKPSHGHLRRPTPLSPPGRQKVGSTVSQAQYLARDIRVSQTLVSLSLPRGSLVKGGNAVMNR